MTELERVHLERLFGAELVLHWGFLFSHLIDTYDGCEAGSPFV